MKPICKLNQRLHFHVKPQFLANTSSELSHTITYNSKFSLHIWRRTTSSYGSKDPDAKAVVRIVKVNRSGRGDQPHGSLNTCTHLNLTFRVLRINFGSNNPFINLLLFMFRLKKLKLASLDSQKSQHAFIKLKPCAVWMVSVAEMVNVHFGSKSGFSHGKCKVADSTAVGSRIYIQDEINCLIKLKEKKVEKSVIKE